MHLFSKIKGEGAALPVRASMKSILLAGLGSTLAIAALAGSNVLSDLGLILGSFGASCVLLFGFPDVPFSQPRNLVIGHLLCSFSGLLFMSVLGFDWWVVALAVGVAVMAMMLTQTVHPPAGSNPVIIYLLQPDWHFLITPTLAGALILLVIALIYNNLTREAKYPKYW